MYICIIHIYNESVAFLSSSTMTASDEESLMKDVEDLRSKLSGLELRAMDELRIEAVMMSGAHMTAAVQVTDTYVAFRLRSTQSRNEKNFEEAEGKRRKTEQDQMEYEDKVVLPEQQEKTEQHQEDSEQLVPLRRIDKGFEKWLKQKSEEELERVMNQVMRDHTNEQECKAYANFVRSLEHIGKNCTKCRRTGCESCTYVHALRYVVKHQEPGKWWRRTGQSAVLGC